MPEGEEAVKPCPRIGRIALVDKYRIEGHVDYPVPFETAVVEIPVLLPDDLVVHVWFPCRLEGADGTSLRFLYRCFMLFLFDRVVGEEFHDCVTFIDASAGF